MKTAQNKVTTTRAKIVPKTQLERTGKDRLSASDFLLAPDAFVRRCASVFLKKNIALSPHETEQLAVAIQKGRPRFEIVDLICAKANPIDPRLFRPRLNPAALNISPFIVPELLKRFSPDNDEMFVVEVYEQAAGRAPAGTELADGCIELKRGLLNRQQFIQKITERFEIRKLAQEQENTINSTNIGLAGAFISENGRESIGLLRYLSSLNAPDLLRQPIDAQNSKVNVPEGWLLVAPKLSLRPGLWSLEVDVIQPANARLLVHLSANSGLDKLINIDITGSCVGAFCFNLTAQHQFIEAGIFKPKQSDTLHALTIRNFSISTQVQNVSA